MAIATRLKVDMQTEIPVIKQNDIFDQNRYIYNVQTAVKRSYLNSLSTRFSDSVALIVTCIHCTSVIFSDSLMPCKIESNKSLIRSLKSTKLCEKNITKWHSYW